MTIVDHPLLQHKLAQLRDQSTSMADFRELIAEISTLLTVEATRDLALQSRSVKTPVATTEAHVIAEPKPLVVPILRAGLGMLDSFLAMVPVAEAGFYGLKRNEETLEPDFYAQRLPERLDGRRVFLLDPMLATGGSLVAAISDLLARGAAHVTAICIVSAPEGIAAVEAAFTDAPVELIVATRDERLNAEGYIVPGLGDAGDRLYG